MTAGDANVYVVCNFVMYVQCPIDVADHNLGIHVVSSQGISDDITGNNRHIRTIDAKERNECLMHSLSLLGSRPALTETAALLLSCSWLWR